MQLCYIRWETLLKWIWKASAADYFQLRLIILSIFSRSKCNALPMTWPTPFIAILKFFLTQLSCTHTEEESLTDFVLEGWRGVRLALWSNALKSDFVREDLDALLNFKCSLWMHFRLHSLQPVTDMSGHSLEPFLRIDIIFINRWIRR